MPEVLGRHSDLLKPSHHPFDKRRTRTEKCTFLSLVEQDMLPFTNAVPNRTIGSGGKTLRLISIFLSVGMSGSALADQSSEIYSRVIGSTGPSRVRVLVREDGSGAAYKFETCTDALESKCTPVASKEWFSQTELEGIYSRCLKLAKFGAYTETKYAVGTGGLLTAGVLALALNFKHGMMFGMADKAVNGSVATCYLAAAGMFFAGTQSSKAITRTALSRTQALKDFVKQNRCTDIPINAPIATYASNLKAILNGNCAGPNDTETKTEAARPLDAAGSH